MSDMDRWKAGLLTVADEPFFDLVRNYLGPISSPFHKPELVDRLAAFLLRDDVQRAVVAALGEQDRALLAAIDLTENANTERLLGISALGMEAVELHHRLVNLEDRLLVFAEPQSGVLRLNPVLAPALRQTGIGLNALITMEHLDLNPPAYHPMDEPMVAAVLSFVAEFPEPLKSDGSVRKRIAVEISARMPALSGENSATRRFAALVTASKRLGLLDESADGRLFVDRAALLDYGNTATGVRLPLLWSAVALAAIGILEDTGDNSLRAIADALAFVISSVPANQATGSSGFAGLLSLAAGRTVPATVVHELTAAGVLWSPDGERFAVHPAAAERLRTGESQTGEPISRVATPGARVSASVLEPNYEISISPDVSLSEVAPLIPLLDLRSLDRVSRYEITRQGIGRGIRAGIGREQILPALEQLTGRTAPQNVAFSLSQWAADYDAIELIDCVMLTVNEERRHLVDHSPELVPFILQRPAPGVFALDRNREAQWSAILRNIGIAVLPRIAGRDHSTSSASGANRLHNLLSPARRDHDAGLIAHLARSRPVEPERAPTRRTSAAGDEARERTLIEQLARSGISDSGREELALRIRRKLVLLPEQIRGGAVRPERREAKGLDYIGKVRIIEEAVRTAGIHLEVILRDKSGRPQRFLLRPQTLDKKGKGLVLVGVTMPEQDTVRIEVGKIALVRKLRGSLFHGTRKE